MDIAVSRFLYLIPAVFLLSACGDTSNLSNENKTGNRDYNAVLLVNSVFLYGSEMEIRGHNFDTGEFTKPVVTTNQPFPFNVGNFSDTLIQAGAFNQNPSDAYFITVKNGEGIDNYDAYGLVSVNAVDNGVFNQLLIIDVGGYKGKDGEARLFIAGYNFDNGDRPPVVSINGTQLEIDNDMSSPKLLVAIIPPGAMDGIMDISERIVLTVQSGETNESYDAYELSGIVFEEILGVLACNRTDKAKVFVSGEHCCTTSRQDLCWKTGPIREDTKDFFFNSDQIPRYFELTEDFVIPVEPYFDDPPPVAFPTFARVIGDSEPSEKREDLYRLIEPLPMIFKYEVEPLGDTRKWDFLRYSNGHLIIKKGYRWDGASVGWDRKKYDDRLLRTYLFNMRSSLIHDAFYDLIRLDFMEVWHEAPWNGGTRDYRDVADTLFYLTAKEDGHADDNGLKLFYKTLRRLGHTKSKLHGEKNAGWRFHSQAIAKISSDEVNILIDEEGQKSFTLSCADEADEIKFNASSTWPIATTPQLGEYQDNLHETTWHWSMKPEGQSPFNITNIKQNYVDVTFDRDQLVSILTVDELLSMGMQGGVDNEIKLYIDKDKNTDTAFFETTDKVKFNVEFDTEPPVINGISESLFDWPPNHKYKTFNIEDFVISVSDNCSELGLDDLIITQVSSDEPDNDRGDGSTVDDTMIATDGKSVDIRIEREGMGNGRVYTIDIQATDERSNSATESFQVHIPHDKN